MTAPLTPEALVEALVACLEENDHRSRYQQAVALLSGPLVPVITDAAEARAALAAATAEAASLRAEVEAKDRALKAKAEEQVAYWRERQRTEKCLEDGVSEDGQTYTPIGDEAAWQAGYCNGRMSEADWWAKTFHYWPNEAARAATAREG